VLSAPLLGLISSKRCPSDSSAGTAISWAFTVSLLHSSTFTQSLTKSFSQLVVYDFFTPDSAASWIRTPERNDNLATPLDRMDISAMLRGFFAKADGQSLVGYALILVLIGMVVMGTLRLLGNKVSIVFSSINNGLSYTDTSALAASDCAWSQHNAPGLSQAALSWSV
jgi:pilus assembly protein Flp/PilA